jgi:hypothetical protein
MARRSTRLPGNVLAQLARPASRMNGHPSSTPVSTCRSRSMRHCGRSPSRSVSKSMSSCWRVSMQHCDGVGIRRARVSKPGRSGRRFRQAWTARSQKRRPARARRQRPSPAGEVGAKAPGGARPCHAEFSFDGYPLSLVLFVACPRVLRYCPRNLSARSTGVCG